jgi:hypothetical protein
LRSFAANLASRGGHQPLSLLADIILHPGVEAAE